MSKKILMIFVTVFAAVLPGIAGAVRAENSPDCKPAAVIDQANKLKSTGDSAKDLAALQKLSDQISAQNIACTGFTFKGKGNKVLPPFTLPAGFYKITAQSKGYLIVDSRSLEGSPCEANKEINLFNLLDDQASIGAETTLNVSVDCRILLTTSNSRADWTISFEILK